MLLNEFSDTMRSMKKAHQAIKLLIFLFCSVLAIIIIIKMTGNENTLEALKYLGPQSIAVLSLIWLVDVNMDAFSIIFLARAANSRLRYFSALRAATIKTFFNIITPFSFGGQPILIYILNRDKISQGKASAILVSKLLGLSFFMLAFSSLSFYVYHDSLKNIPALSTALLITALLFAALIVTAIFCLLKPKLLIYIVLGLGRLLRKIGFKKLERRFEKTFISEAAIARRSFRMYFRKNLPAFLAAFLCIGISYLAQILLVWYILRIFNIYMPLVQGIALGSLLLFLIAFMPTPGSAGLAEAILLLLLKNESMVAEHLYALVLILWRFFYHYTSGSLGAIFSLHHFSRLKSKKAEAK